MVKKDKQKNNMQSKTFILT